MDKQISEKLKRTASFILAMAMQRLYPGAKLSIGPATEEGFFYEFGVDEDLYKKRKKLFPALEEEIHNIIEEELPITQTYIQRDNAIDMLHQRGQIFKAELLQNTHEDEISFYKIGDDFIDLSRKALETNTSKVGAIKLTAIESVHWLNDENRPELWRIYGLVFTNKKELEHYETQQSQLKERVHTKTGSKYAVYEKPNGQSDVTLLYKGSRLANILINAFKKELREEGVGEIHASQFKLISELKENEFAKFYREHDLIELSENMAYANNPIKDTIPALKELLKRARQDKQALEAKVMNKSIILDPDALQTEEQGLYDTLEKNRLLAHYVSEEANLAKDLRELLTIAVTYYRKILDGNLHFQVNSKANLNHAQILEVLPEFNFNIRKTRDDSEFGIKLRYKDIFNKTWDLMVINFNEKVSKYFEDSHNERLVFFEAVLIPSLESLIAILTEKYDGNYPISIAPYQAVVIPEHKDFVDYATSVYKQLLDKGLRVEVAREEEDFAKKLKRAETNRIPYILTIGESDQQNNVFSVRTSQKEELGLMNVEEFLQKVRELS